jgi:cyclophilin family peptidyl-prolyl cis-trans isomerase
MARKTVQSNQAQFILTVGIVLVAFIIILAASIKGNDIEDNNLGNKDTYQAVFLDNGQTVYFGKLNNANSETPDLTDVYYIRSEELENEEGESKQQLSLVKFGDNEIHGPTDQIFLSRERILFWQNLRADSRVVRLIDQHKAQVAQQSTALQGGEAVPGAPVAPPIPTPTVE